MPNPNDPEQAECRICHDIGTVPGTERRCSCRGEADDEMITDIARSHFIEVSFSDVPRAVMALLLGHRWPASPILLDMGAEWEFDYADLPSDEQTINTRVTRCYEIAATAIVSTDAVRSQAEAEYLPMPETLIHGSWSSPEARHRPIHHAWVLLDDGRIWEPISRTICDPVKFAQYTQCVSHHVYTPEAARFNMLRTSHYGRWA